MYSYLVDLMYTISEKVFGGMVLAMVLCGSYSMCHLARAQYEIDTLEYECCYPVMQRFHQVCYQRTCG